MGVDEWLETIEDEELKALLSKNVIITGGCIASMLLREKVNDYDIYFRNKEAAEKAALYYVERFEVKNKNGIPCEIRVDTSSKVDTGEDRVRIVIKSSGIASEEGTGEEYRYFEANPPVYLTLCRSI